MTYTTKIKLSGIAKIKTGYVDNTNDYYFKKSSEPCDHASTVAMSSVIP